MITIAANDFHPSYDPDRPDHDNIQTWHDADWWARVSGLLLDAPRYAEAAQMPEEAKPWADAVVDGATGSLVLWGPTGTGKTYSACAVGRYLATASKKIQYGPHPLKMVTASTWLTRVKSGPWDEREERFEKAARAGLLVLDDIARSRVTEKDRETLSELLDARMMHLRPTIFTTNRMPYLPDGDEDPLPDGHELKGELYDLVGAHLVSRMLGDGSVVIEMAGADRRNPEGAL